MTVILIIHVKSRSWQVCRSSIIEPLFEGQMCVCVRACEQHTSTSLTWHSFPVKLCSETNDHFFQNEVNDQSKSKETKMGST